jgi:hypothetical protein
MTYPEDDNPQWCNNEDAPPEEGPESIFVQVNIEERDDSDD